MTDNLPRVGDKVWSSYPGWEPSVLTVTKVDPSPTTRDETTVWSVGWVLLGQSEPYNEGKPLFTNLDMWNRFMAPCVSFNTPDDIEQFLEEG